MARSKKAITSVPADINRSGLRYQRSPLFLEELIHPVFGKIIVQFKTPVDGVELYAVSRRPTPEEKLGGGALWKLEYLTKEELIALRK